MTISDATSNRLVDGNGTPAEPSPPAEEIRMRYFELAGQADTDEYFAQFTDDAVVEDEGREHHGIAEIQAWRTEIPSVHYDVLDVDRRGNSALARVEISGTFPGSPVTLTSAFEYTSEDRIAGLRIRG